MHAFVPLSRRSRYSAASINICTIPMAAIINKKPLFNAKINK